MQTIPEAMKAYLETHAFDSDSDDCVCFVAEVAINCFRYVCFIDKLKPNLLTFEALTMWQMVDFLF